MNQEKRSDLLGILSVVFCSEAIVVLIIFMGAVIGSQVGSLTAAIGQWVGQ